jgi:hypothetical protein
MISDSVYGSLEYIIYPFLTQFYKNFKHAILTNNNQLIIKENRCYTDFYSHYT